MRDIHFSRTETDRRTKAVAGGRTWGNSISLRTFGLVSPFWGNVCLGNVSINSVPGPQMLGPSLLMMLRERVVLTGATALDDL